MTDHSYNQPSAEEKLNSSASPYRKAFVSFYACRLVVTGLLGLADFWNWFSAQSGFVRCSSSRRCGRCLTSSSPGCSRGLVMFAERLCQSAAAAIEFIGSAVANILTCLLRQPPALRSALSNSRFFRCASFANSSGIKAKRRPAFGFRPGVKSRKSAACTVKNSVSIFAASGTSSGISTIPAALISDRASPSLSPEPERKPEPPKPDAFTEACRLFGLPESGSFTQEELKKRYRAAMLKAHPDRGGTDALAMEINIANTTIKRRKGWS